MRFDLSDEEWTLLEPLMINTPQSPVPLAAPGMSVNYYRFGLNARLAVAMDPSLVDLEGTIITQLVGWDFVNQRLQPYVASGATEAITSQTWSATNGGQVAVVMTGASVLALGDTLAIGLVVAGLAVLGIGPIRTAYSTARASTAAKAGK